MKYKKNGKITNVNLESVTDGEQKQRGLYYSVDINVDNLGIYSKVFVNQVRGMNVVPEIGRRVLFDFTHRQCILSDDDLPLPTREYEGSTIYSNGSENTLIEAGDKNIDLKTAGGCEIKMESKIKISNKTKDLKTILINSTNQNLNLIAVLQLLTVIDPISGLLPLSPESITALTNLISPLNTTLNDLEGLLD